MTVVGKVPSRTCGRCRQVFDGDPALHEDAIPDWWACEPCRAKLGLMPDGAAADADADAS
jgi:hypothetical protein